MNITKHSILRLSKYVCKYVYAPSSTLCSFSSMQVLPLGDLVHYKFSYLHFCLLLKEPVLREIILMQNSEVLCGNNAKCLRKNYIRSIT